MSVLQITPILYESQRIQETSERVHTRPIQGGTRQRRQRRLEESIWLHKSQDWFPRTRRTMRADVRLALRQKPNEWKIRSKIYPQIIPKYDSNQNHKALWKTSRRAIRWQHTLQDLVQGCTETAQEKLPLSSERPDLQETDLRKGRKILTMVRLSRVNTIHLRSRNRLVLRTKMSHNEASPHHHLQNTPKWLLVLYFYPLWRRQTQWHRGFMISLLSSHQPEMMILTF